MLKNGELIGFIARVDDSKPDDIDYSKRVAEKMVTDGLPALQGLAQAIADAAGLYCEQETLYDKVFPALAGQLSAIEGSRRHPE